MVSRVIASCRTRKKKKAISGMLLVSALALLTGLVAGLLTLVAAPAQATVGEQGSEPQEPPAIQSLFSNPDRPEVVGDQLLVVFRKGMNALAAQQLVGKYGATVQEVLPLATKYAGQKIVVIRASGLGATGLYDRLRSDPAVAAVSLNYKQTAAATVPNDPMFGELWGLNNTSQTGGITDSDIDAPEAWDVSTGSATVVVADIDSGVDYTHEDLVGNVWVNPYETAGDGIDNDGNGYIDDVYGIDTAYGDSDPWDDHGHGTHTAGTIAAVGDNGVGVTGVAWSTKVMAVKFLDELGFGSDAGAVEAIYYVIGQKLNYDVNVVAINASWGGGGYDPILEQAIADAGDAGIIFVAAAGNDQSNTDLVPDYPSCYDVPSIVSVGATDDDDSRTWFTNVGASTVDLFAPGEHILSTVPRFSYTPAAGDYFFDDMESGAGKWAAPEGAWAITTEKAQSGTHSWSDSPAGDYADDLEASITTTSIDLTTGPTHPLFGFSAYYELGPEGWDTLVVEFSGDDGATWEVVTGFYGSSSGLWESTAVPIPATFRTDQFRARFHLITASDDGVSDGVYIDDVGIGEAPASDNYERWSGTSMAAPHVTGSIAVLAAEYPDDEALELISRIRSGVDVVSKLAGLANTGGRLNLARSLDPALVPGPWITEFVHERPVRAGSPLTIEGVLFGSAQGRVLLSDGVTEVEAPVVSWADGLVEATMPETRNSSVILERFDGMRCAVGAVSAWAAGDRSIISRDGNTALSWGGAIISMGGYTQGGWLATSTIELYDPDAEMWMAISRLRLLEPRVYAASVSVGESLYVIGGYEDAGGQAHDNTWAYDFWANEWMAMAPLPQPLMLHEAVEVDGLIWVFGGCDETGAMNPDMFVYDPEVDSWAVLEGPSVPRVDGAGVAWDGLIYFLGGFDLDTEEYLDTAEVYDPFDGTWSSVTGLPIPLARMGVAEYGGMAYLVGGTNTDWWLGGTATLLRFDPVAQTWRDLSPTVLALPAESAVHSSPAVAIAEYGIYSVNGLSWEMSSDRVDLLPEATLSVSITSLEPAGGPVAGGNEVAILGTNFYEVTGVTFGGVPATGYTVDSPGRIVATAPAGTAGVVRVQVDSAGGSSPDTEADDYRYAEVPSVTSLDPASGSIAGGNEVVIMGTDFYEVSSVTFGGVPATFDVDSSTQITATAPAGALGQVRVAVSAAGGITPDTPADDYTYAVAPTITGLSIHTGPATGGTTVVITGTGFTGLTGADAVTFGGVAAASYARVSDVQITAVSPAHDTGAVQVKVVAEGGGTSDGAADDFTYVVAYTSLRGVDRYDTAVKISKAMFPGALPLGSGLVLAPGDTYQEALCGAPLAAAYGGPVLLTPRSGLTAEVRAEIIRLRPQTVVCIGLSDTMKNRVQTVLGATGTATVIRGTSVYDMSYRVAKALGAKVGDLSGATAIVTRGDMFPDAIGVSPLSCAQRWPVLLTGGSSVLTASAVKTLNELGVHAAIKVGTYAALPEGVIGLANLSGSDRYATNVNVARWAQAHTGLSFTHLGIVTGDKFPDALAAGPYLAQDRGIVLLSPLYGPLPGVVAAEITANSGEVRHVSFMGMIEPVIGQVKGLVP